LKVVSAKVDFAPGIPIPSAPTLLTTLDIPHPSPFYFVLTGGQILAAAGALVLLIQQVGKNGAGQTQNGKSFSVVFGDQFGLPTFNFSGVFQPDTTLTDNTYQFIWFGTWAGATLYASTITILAIQEEYSSATPLIETGHRMGALSMDLKLPPKFKSIGPSTDIPLADTTDGGNVIVVANFGALKFNTTGVLGSTYGIRIRVYTTKGAPAPIQWPGWEQGVIAQQEFMWPGCAPLIVAAITLPRSLGLVISTELMDADGHLSLPGGTPYSMFMLQEQRLSASPGNLLLRQLIDVNYDADIDTLPDPAMFADRPFAPGTMYSIAYAGKVFGDPSGTTDLLLWDEEHNNMAAVGITQTNAPVMVCGSSRLATSTMPKMGGHLTMLPTAPVPGYIKAHNAMTMAGIFIPD
jgi:hypothetical protein